MQRMSTVTNPKIVEFVNTLNFLLRFENCNNFIKNKKNFNEEENKIKLEEIKQDTDKLNLLKKELDDIYENYNTPDYYATNIDKTPPTQIYLTENAAMFVSVTWSTILECNIKDVKGVSISSGKTKYKHILVDILKTMDPMEVKTKLTESKFKFKLTNESGRDGYIWDSCLKLSIKGETANDTFRAIMATIPRKYTIQITIKFETGEIYQFIK
jgi:hypothetical protein